LPATATPRAALAPLDAAQAYRIRVAAWLAAAVAVVSRLPFAARRLWDHDSVQFALGVERYDLAAHHPHPPGYPLYIAVLKGLAAAGVDSLHGMVGLSVLAAALGAGCMVLLVGRLVGEAARMGEREEASAPLGAGLFAAALFVFNPLLWFYGELPLVYAVEGGMTVALAWAAVRMADGRGPLLAACAAFALAGGIRPSTLLLLLPLFGFGVWRAWRRGAGWGRLAIGAAVALAVGLAWLLPLLAAAGGLAGYRRISQEHFSALLPYTSILYGAGPRALAHNLTIMTKWFLQGLLPAAAALALLWLLPPRPLAAAAGLRQLRRAAPLLAVWALPPIAFFALFHITKAGYTLVYLPALLVAAALLAAPALTAGSEAEGKAPVAAGEGVERGAPAARTEGARPPAAGDRREAPVAAGEGVERGAPAARTEGERPPAAGDRREAPVVAGEGVESWAPAARTEGERPPTAGGGREGAAAVSERVVVSETERDARSAQPAAPLPAAAGGPRWRSLAGIALAAAVGAGFFLFGADRRPDQPRALAVVRNEFNRGAIATYERDLDRLLGVLRAFPPGTTTLATVELSGTGAGGPDAFLYPWQRHLQWYLPAYEVLHLVPEDRLVFATQGHRPFHRLGPHLTLAPGTERLAIVLAGPTGSRFPLPSPLRPIGTTIDLVFVPIPANAPLHLGPFTFTAAPAQAAATPSRPAA
jgi:hypothetical protein